MKYSQVRMIEARLQLAQARESLRNLFGAGLPLEALEPVTQAFEEVQTAEEVVAKIIAGYNVEDDPE